MRCGKVPIMKHRRIVWVVLLAILLSGCGVYQVEDASIERVALESVPGALAVKVVVYGVLGNGCTQVGEVKQHREDKTFFVTIKTIYAQPAGTACTQAIGVFREEIILDVAGLKSGSYAVNVNGVVETFTLPLDERVTYAATVEAVVVLLESYPVQVVVTARGSLRSGCEEIAGVSQRFEDDTFFVTVLGSFPPGTTCPPVAPPFTERVTLTTADLVSGTYKVNVNDVVESFTLP